ncbi:MAG: methyltransferase family protein, partial [Wenzhouxiangella sp.]
MFSLLEREGGMTGGQIARRLGLEPYPTRVLLLGLTATGLLRKKKNRYSNGPVARRVLVSDSPRKLTAYVELEHQVM